MANSFNVRLDGLGGVLKSLTANSLKGVAHATAEIKFDAEYAVYVHEDLSVYHPNGQAKFLEVAYRQNINAAREVIKKKLIAKRGLLDSIKAGAELILVEAQKITPVDTGYLRASGHVVVR